MNIPVPDGANYEPFESLVELYYQIEGYITSSGKWITKGRDIDVLAIGENETIIVSVTTNLKDKEPTGLQDYFRNTEDFLRSVKEYNWLVNDSREVKYSVAFHEPFDNKKKQQQFEIELKKNGILLLSVRDIFRAISGYFDKNLTGPNRNIKSQNQIFRTLQILKRLGWFKCNVT